MKTRRQGRVSRLTDIGFLKFEARELSAISPKVPYMRGIMSSRSRDHKQAVKEGMTVAAWNAKIKRMYRDKGWLKSDTRQYDAWKMLRAYEDGYKLKTPQYESPRMTKTSKHPDFQAKLDRMYSKPSRLTIKQQRERDDYNQRIVRAISDGNQVLRRKLEDERNRKFGY